MAKHLSIIHLLLLAITLTCVNAARILTEDGPDPLIITAPGPTFPDPTPLPITDIAPTVGPADLAPVVAPLPITDIAPTVGPAALAPVVAPDLISPPITDMAPTAGPADMAPVPPPVTEESPVVTPINVAPAPSGGAAKVANTDPHLTFFVHDILGGITPSARIVTGIIANSEINGIPFSKTNGGIFPATGAIPLGNNNGHINNHNLPFLAGLTGATTSTTFQNNGNNNAITNQNSLPFVTPGQVPTGSTLQSLMFGTLTVIDDEVTEGRELGSSVLGKVQGFYLASSVDGTSHTMALTALFRNGDNHEEDTLSFFGVHRTASPESQVAIVGGTGKYENAKGYATVVTHHQTDQHTTDGVDTLLQFSIYLSH